MEDKRSFQILINEDALESLIPTGEKRTIKVKLLRELNVGNYVEGLGKVVRIEGRVLIVLSQKGEKPLNKKGLNYPVTVINTLQ